MELLDIKSNDPCAISIFGLIFFCSFFSLMFTTLYWNYATSKEKLIEIIEIQRNELKIVNSQLKKSNLDLKNILDRQQYILLSLSHELRNPMNIISGSSELALFEETKEATESHLENIKDTIELLAHYATNLLFESQIEESFFKIKCDWYDTNKLMSKVHSITRILLIKNGLHGNVFISKNMPKSIQIDSIRLTQIIYNLIANAVKFTKEGFIGVLCSWINEEEVKDYMKKPTNDELFRLHLNNDYLNSKITQNNAVIWDDTNQRLSLSLINEVDDTTENEFGNFLEEKKRAINIRVISPKMISSTELFSQYHKMDLNNFSLRLTNQQNKATGFLKIEIIDSGCGIEKEDISKLFQKFEQVGLSNHNRLGVGLGLWITKALCNKMNGDIEVHSKLKKGSTFIALIKCT